MRKGAQNFNYLDVDRFPQPAVNRSSSDEMVDPSGSNAGGEHDAADDVDDFPAVRLPVRGALARHDQPRPRNPVSERVETHARLAGRGLGAAATATEGDVPRDALAPVEPVETALAERVASAVWRLRRVIAYEEATLAERQRLETPSARLLPHPVDIDKVVRYEAHLSRQLYQALHELEAMRAARRGQAAPLLRVDVHTEVETLAAMGRPCKATSMRPAKSDATSNRRRGLPVAVLREEAS